MTSASLPATGTGGRDAPGDGPRPVSARTVRRLARLVLAASAALAALGVVWLLVPGSSPFAELLVSPLGALLGPSAVAGIAIGSGAVGALLAAEPAGSGRLPRPGAVAAASAPLLVVGLAAFGSVGILAYAGYLFGQFAVLAAIAAVVVSLVRAPRVGIRFLLGLAAIVAVVVFVGGVDLDGLGAFLAMFAAAVVPQLGALAVSLVIVVAVLAWAALGAAAFGASDGGRRFEAWLVRHRTAITVLAALGPLPYALVRASWLTPWPLWAPDDVEMGGALLVTGLMLGSGAVAAAILTIGLVRPWSLRFPAWMPAVGRAPVPPAFPIGFGLFAATVLCLAAVPMVLLLGAGAESPLQLLEALVVLPIWYWGPTLALAVWAYAARRRTEPVAA